MAMLLNIPSAFDRFKREGELLGRLVIEYGALEWDFCLLVSAITGDKDAALKAMYRSRGETQRIDVGDALARNRLTKDAFRTVYEQTVANLRVCLKIRNQYAHTNWVDMMGDGLGFVNVEEMAHSHAPIDTNDQKLYSLNLKVIEDQQRFFVQVDQNLHYLIMEAQFKSGATDLTGFHYVKNIRHPLMASAVPEDAANISRGE